MLNLGDNLARIRTARGLTQDELAGASGVSVDTISRLERGAHQTARRATLHSLAGSLSVDPGRLLGLAPPEQDTPGAEQLRRAVRALDIPDLAEPDAVPPLTELHDAASGAWSDYLDGKQTELLAGLPALMVDTRRAVHSMAGDHGAEAAGLLATAYRLSAGLAGRLELVDLAAHAAHRALDTAAYTTHPDLDRAAALRYLAWVLVRQGDLAEAERVALRAAETLDTGLMARPDPDQVGVFGSLMLNAAGAAARAGTADRAEDHLAVADAASRRSGTDRTAEAGVFGPRVAAIQAVDQAVRIGDPERALVLADRVPDVKGAVPAFWEAGHRLHLAAACDDLDRWADVGKHLSAARALAPQWTRLQPLGQVVIGHLVEHRGRRSEHVSGLADYFATVP